MGRIQTRGPMRVNNIPRMAVMVQFPAGERSTVSLRGVQRRSNLLWSSVGDCFATLAMTSPPGSLTPRNSMHTNGRKCSAT